MVRRNQILEEAIQIVGQRGSNGFTVQELAQRCGLSNAGLLYHFGSREQLLLATLQELERREIRIIQPFVRAAEEELKRRKPSRRKLLQLLHTMVMRGSIHLELGLPFMVLQAEALERGHPAYPYFRSRDEKVLDLFTRLAAPHVECPESTARQLLALMDGFAQQWVRSNRSFDLVAEWDRAVATVTGGTTESMRVAASDGSGGSPRRAARRAPRRR